MSLGTGLLFSALVLGGVLLYGFTKDRWRWRRIVAVIAVACVALVVLAAAGLALLDRRNQAASERRLQADRRAHAVKIGDVYSTVLQRQGSPDSTVMFDRDEGFVIAYWEDYRSSADINKAFFFTPDSVLSEIRFMGRPYESIEYSWMPEDRVTLGTSKDSVLAWLGEPCREELDQARTLLVFQTSDPRVTRFASVGHGAGLVIRHGWSSGPCVANER